MKIPTLNPPLINGTQPSLLSAAINNHSVVASFIGAVATDGWRANSLNIGAFSSSDSFTVQRNGFNSAGNAVTVNDTVYTHAHVREPYPNEDTLTTDTVSLSDFVYAQDVIQGASNNSSLVYPKPQAMWAQHDMEFAESTSHVVDLFVAHRHGRNGTPVAAVRFIATDETGNSYETLVSNLTPKTFSASGLTVPVYRGTIDLSGLNSTEIVTVDAIIYPHVGEAYQLSIDANPYPSSMLTTLKFLNNKDGAYNRVYVYVDTAGDDGTGVASDNSSTASANPFATTAAAAQAAEQVNNSVNGRNDVSGVILRLNPGTHTHSVLGVDSAVVPMTIESTSGDPLDTIYQDAGVDTRNSTPDKLIVKGLTISQTSSSNVEMFSSGASSSTTESFYANMCAVVDCRLENNGFTPYGGMFWRVGRNPFVNCYGNNIGQSASFGSIKSVTNIGCSGEGFLYGITLNAIGTKELGETGTFRQTVPTAVDDFMGAVCAFNHIKGDTNTYTTNGTPIDDRGAAIVGNVFEAVNPSTGPTFRASADSDTNEIRNFNFIQNTVMGARVNFLYQDTGTEYVYKEGILRNSVMYECNTKTDVFGGDSNLTGNWLVRYRVGSNYNTYLRGDSKNTNYGVEAWLADVPGIGEIAGTQVASPLDPDFVNDASESGTALGDGDYTPGANTAIGFVPAANMSYTYDLYGNQAGMSGSDRMGAVFSTGN